MIKSTISRKPRTTRVSRAKVTRAPAIAEYDEVAPVYRAQPQSLVSNPLMIFAFIALAFFAGYLLQKVQTLEQNKTTTATTQATPQTGTQQTTVTLAQVKSLFTKDRIMFGNPNSKLLIVEVSDPSCPYCHIAGGFDPQLSAQVDTQTNRFKYVSDGGTYIPPVPEMKKLVDQGKAAFVWLYSNGHGSGELASEALYCANANGKFWEAHDLLMSYSGYNLLNTQLERDGSGAPLSNDKNIQLVASFLAPTVDSATITDCLTSKKYAAQTTKDQQVSATLGFSGTPYFLINEKPYTGAYSFKDMQADVNKAI